MMSCYETKQVSICSNGAIVQVDLWSSARNPGTDRIQSFQFKALRTILDLPWNASNRALHTNLNIPADQQLDGRTVEGSIGQSAGGVGRNLVDALGKLSGAPPPLFISAVGDDQFGRFLLNSVAHTDSSGVKVRKDYGTACCNVLFDNSGECRIVIGDMKIHNTVSKQQLVGTSFGQYPSSAVLIKTRKLSRLESVRITVSSGLDRVVTKGGSQVSLPMLEASSGDILRSHGRSLFGPVTSLEQSTSFPSSHRWFFPKIREHERAIACSPMVVMDSNIPEESMDYILNTCGGRGIPGVSLNAELNLKDTDVLLKQLTYLATPLVEHITSVMVTMGSHGLLMVSKLTAEDVLLGDGSARLGEVHSRFYQAPNPTSLVNVSGAGDCLAAGFMAGVLRGLSEPECVHLGQQAAALSLQSSSPVPSAFDITKPFKTKFLQLL
ncbi:hypothetical protein AAG570_000363 [Ranatra chinensis]|uniref:Carbohydrate kinase PfkB domain-containing protein n=1 Tax=Ranatra chinensis TaxID=642074 RepID=A0ABD0YWU9_9HEMI